MTVIGTVTTPGRAQSTITVYRSAACGGECGHQCIGCQVAATVTILAENNGWRPQRNQRVRLRPLEHNVVSLAALTYLFPLLIGVGGYVGAEQLFSLGNASAALAALSGLIVGFAPAFLINRRMSSRPTHIIDDVLDDRQTTQTD